MKRKELKRIAVAVDSFKGSLTSSEVAASVASGILRVFPECEVRKAYIADGGEGTVEALVETLGGRYVHADVHDPLMRPIKARYGIVDNGSTAVVEMAAASGLPLLLPDERNPLKTTTFGAGELIADALNRGCRTLYVGIGGSATNDAGMGMMRALGYRFTDAFGVQLQGTGEELVKLHSIDSSALLSDVLGADITVACDVTNPLYGPQGAAYVYAPQKGATPEMVETLDLGLVNFAKVVRRFNGSQIANLSGAGAAGGLGGGMKALLGAHLQRGIEMVLDAMHFEKMIEGCDLVITGEGRIDRQTVMGKAPSGVLQYATGAGIPVIAIGGAVESCDEIAESGFAAVLATISAAVPLEKAMEKEFASANVTRTVEQIMKLIREV